MGSLQQLSVAKGAQTRVPTGLLHKLFEARVDQECGSRAATIFNETGTNAERKMSYNYLNSLTNRLATTMVQELETLNRTQPNQDGDFVIAVCMAPSDYLVSTLLAIWKAGAAYLPLDVSFPTNRIQHIIGESKPILVIHDDNYENVEAFGSSVVSMSYGKLRKLSAENSNANLGVDQTLSKKQTDDLIAIILYTSGSTGIPKGVRLPHSIIMNRLNWQWNRFPYSQTETYGVFKTALTFVDHVSEIWGPLLNSMTLVCVPRDVTKNPDLLIPLLEKYQIERLVLVPTLLRSIFVYLNLRDDKSINPLEHLKLWVCSGETLSVQLAKEFFDHFVEGVHVLANFYGSTEVMGDVTYFVCESKKQLDSLNKIPIGTAIDNTIIYLLDAELQPVKLGEIGEIYASGLNLASGYVNKRDPDRFINNPISFDPKYNRLYKTGDYASIQKGIIFYEGRTDSQIKIRGYRVDLTEIEKQVVSNGAVEKAIVLCYHAGEVDQALLAFCSLKEESRDKTNEFQIEANLQNLLPSYMVPQVIIMDQIPLLVNGKIDRQTLLKSYECSNNNDDAELFLEMDFGGVPENQMDAAKDLFEIVGSVIGRSTRAAIGVQSNFYELGGNSLNSIITVGQLKDKGYHITVTDFITSSNLGEILSKINTIGDQSYLSQIDNCFQSQLRSTPLMAEERESDIEIVRICFYEKADLERYVQPAIQKQDYDSVLIPIWDTLIEQQISFSVKDENNRTVGICLSFDAHNEPEVEVNNNLSIIFGYLESLEGPIRTSQLPQGTGKVVHNFMMATIEDLTAQQNVAVINFMEHEVINVAKRKNFETIFTTNTNPLTQQLATTVYGYRTLFSSQVNQYVAPDNTRPFATAPDSQMALVQSKSV